MLYRRAASTVDALRFDGTERAAREISLWPRTTVALRAGAIEVATAFGRCIVRAGQWVVRDDATSVLSVADDHEFAARYEVVG